MAALHTAAACSLLRRVVIIGPGGSGKTTLADRLGRRLGIPVFNLDSLAWQPGWVPTPREELNRKIVELLPQASWIMDGVYEETLDLRLSACDTVIFLDFPRWLSVWRALRRRLVVQRSAPDDGRGTSYSLTWGLPAWAGTAKASVWKKRFRLWNFHSTMRPRLLTRLKAHEGRKNVLILRSEADVEAFLSTIPRPAAPAQPPEPLSS